jgi:diguanylate cyclase (GGDEF)-like protein
MRTLAIQRRGVERLKAISALWVSANGPLYSVLLPIGGLHIAGYIEVVIDPRYTLQGVSEMTSMPVTILLPGETYHIPRKMKGKSVVLPIEYTLIGDDGQAAYQMIGLENIDKFNRDMLQTQWITVIGFLALIFCVLLLALWLLRIGLFNPLRNLLHGIEEYSEGKLDTTIKPGGLRELYTLGTTFNEMLQRIRDDIRELERFSTIDGLTGIPNRRYFDQCLEHEMSHARRLSSNLSLLYIDIDYFKDYNDRYGHLGGDEALQQVARCIAEMAKRDTDVAARLGGEEFAILLPDTEAENARLLAENLRLAIAHLEIEHQASKVADYLTLSIGVACLVPQRETSSSDLLETADKALYRAKSEGRDRVIVAG